MRFFWQKRKACSVLHRGFSLIELMITIAIVVLVTGAALVRYGSFNSAMLLKSQAYETALDIRQAQAYGVSVSQQTSDARSPYGIAFDESSRSSYQLFQDKDTDGVYDAATEAIGVPYVIDPRFVISNITVNGGACAPSSARVMFRRPNFDAFVTKSGAGCAAVTSLEIVMALANDATEQRTVVVYASGQITVE